MIYSGQVTGHAETVATWPPGGWAIANLFNFGPILSIFVAIFAIVGPLFAAGWLGYSHYSESPQGTVPRVYCDTLDMGPCPEYIMICSGQETPPRVYFERLLARPEYILKDSW